MSSNRIRSETNKEGSILQAKRVKKVKRRGNFEYLFMYVLNTKEDEAKAGGAESKIINLQIKIRKCE